MHLIVHSEWQSTKFTLHLISQIIGKIKMTLTPQEPQWAHVALPLTINGFSTGVLHEGNNSLQLDVNLLEQKIFIHVNEQTEIINLEDGKSIKYYYEAIFHALRYHDIQVTINPKPQEMEYAKLLNEDDTPLEFNPQSAMKGLKLFHYAAHEQGKFLSKLRCRKVKPALFWGTFDVSSIIIRNLEHPFPEDKVIEKAAFDEQMIEFGFWLGDASKDTPTFFILPYPFLFKELPTDTLRPEAAYYDANLSEFFLSLKDASSEDIQSFFQTSFDILVHELGWEETAHYFLPLKMEKNSLL